MTQEPPAHENPDVSALMEAIRRLIRESGGAIPTPGEELAAVAGRLEALITEARIRPALLEEMRLEGGQWNITGQFAMPGHRTGIIGWTVGLVKQVMRRCGALLGKPLVHRQGEINAYLRMVVHHLLLEQVRTERKVAHLERALQARGAPDEKKLRSDALDGIDRLAREPGDDGR